MTHRITAALLCLAAAACTDITPLAPPSSDAAQAVQAGQGTLKDRYIVLLRDGTGDVPGVARRMASGPGASVHFVYEHAVRGFAATLPPAAVAALQGNPQVRAIYPDAPVQQYATASWGIDRIDQRNLPLNGQFLPINWAQGVRIYIVDSGIQLGHSEFNGRAIAGWDAFRQPGDPLYSQDCLGGPFSPHNTGYNGHGTHVAGTAGGGSYGVARQAQLVSVRVFTCGGTSQPISTPNGTVSSLVAGIDWVTSQPQRPAIANLSGGLSASDAAVPALEAAVQGLLASGVQLIAAAGNANADACNYSPARMPAIVTVASSTTADGRASDSNYGSCVDIFAPGEGINSAYPYDTLASPWAVSTTTSAVKSGTSMATPHVTGVGATYLKLNPTATPAQVHAHVVNTATLNKISNPGTGTPNRLLFVPQPLTAAITGPDQTQAMTTQTWASSVAGGEGAGTYTYKWERRTWANDFPGNWSTLSTSPTVSYTTGGSFSLAFEWRLTVVSGTQTVIARKCIRSPTGQTGGCSTSAP